jgi:hypothetical protein
MQNFESFYALIFHFISCLVVHAFLGLEACQAVLRHIEKARGSGERIGSVTLIPKQDVLAIARQRGIMLP